MLLLLRFQPPGEATEALRPGHQTACGNAHLESCPSDLTLCPDVKVMIPDDLSTISSALEMNIGKRRVLLLLIDLDRSMLVLAIC